MTWAIHVGDCRHELARMPAGSVDAVVCDPPYGLSNEPDMAEVLAHWLAGDDYTHTGGGFMGKAWDSFVPGPAVWRECLRVLRPGGHLVAFGGTRTYDMLTLAIRLAGFEVRDCLMWVYGCLTDDVEVLTEHGWVHGVDVAEGDRIAQWDSASGELTLAAVAETYRAPWDGPMRVLRNADTDQVLTPNHRVYHRTQRRQQVAGVRRCWFDDEWQVSEAAELTTHQPMKLPIAGHVDGPGIGGADYAALLGWVFTEGGFDHSGTGVRIYQSSVNADHVAEIGALLDRLGPHKRYDRDRSYKGRNYVESTWFVTGELAERVRADLPGKRPTYPLLWRMTMPEREAFLDAAMKGDGTGWCGTSPQFFQQHEDDLEWVQTLLHTMNRAGKVGMRPNRLGGAVYLRDTATTELQARHHKAATWEHYQGDVWCVRVPTGAFLARRNGKVFITGNSGFPKSLNVAKAVDSTLGVKGELGGPRSEAHAGWIQRGRMRGAGDTADGHAGWQSPWMDDSDAVDRNARQYIPGSPEAQQWDGWGTALKPAWEPIVLARKPLEGTVAANVLDHGVGALNINDCRVGTEDGYTNPTSWGGGEGWTGNKGAGPRIDNGGRWPANVLLGHNDDCVRVGVRVDRVGGGEHATSGFVDGYEAGDGFVGSDVTTDVWECVDGCPVAALDAQSGDVKGAVGMTQHGSGTNTVYGTYARSEASVGGAGVPDSGGASRFFYQAKANRRERQFGLPDGVRNDHPTVKPWALLDWLIRLVCPPSGTVVDPFCGSGTTGIAAVRAGYRFIGVELDPHYAVDLAMPRVAAAADPSRPPIDYSSPTVLRDRPVPEPELTLF